MCIGEVDVGMVVSHHIDFVVVACREQTKHRHNTQNCVVIIIVIICC